MGGEEDRVSTNRGRGRERWNGRGTGGQGGRWGEEEEKYRVGKQQIEMGKVSNGMKRQREVLWFGGTGS